MIGVVVVLALIIGAVGGYFVGFTKGEDNLLAQQKSAEEAALQAAQEEIAKKANPFEAITNPLEDGYQNPFEQTTVNPFR